MSVVLGQPVDEFEDRAQKELFELEGHTWQGSEGAVWAGGPHIALGGWGDGWYEKITWKTTLAREKNFMGLECSVWERQDMNHFYLHKGLFNKHPKPFWWIQDYKLRLRKITVSLKQCCKNNCCM